MRIAICGAGIAGLATAHYVLKSHSNCTVFLIDKNQPMSLTTSKSGENFRDYWPHKCMRWLSRHSISLMKELEKDPLNENFKLNFKGYHFLSNYGFRQNFQDEENESFLFANDVLFDPKKIHHRYPYLNKDLKKSILIRNAGDFSVHDLGYLLLKLSRNQGLQFIQKEIVGIKQNESNLKLSFLGNERIKVDKIILCPGPFLNTLAGMLGMNFQIENHLQRKFIIPDPNDIIPSDMPFTILADSQYLSWTDEELTWIQDEGLDELSNELPGGLHIKPVGQDQIKMGWAFNRKNEKPSWQNRDSEFFVEVVLKGATRLIPGLGIYLDNIPTPCIQYAGYYTRTRENWPLIGPTAMRNVFVVGALSGFGTMVACAAGDICARYVCENDIPSIGQYFTFDRYENDDVRTEIAEAISDGQL